MLLQRARQLRTGKVRICGTWSWSSVPTKNEDSYRLRRVHPLQCRAIDKPFLVRS